MLIAIGRDTNNESILGNVAAHSSVEFIPPAKNRAPVRIGLALDDGMMNAMHPWRDKDQIQNPLQLNRQPPVGMMKTSRGFKRDEKDDERERSNAKHDQSYRKKTSREKHFAKMEARGGSHIHIEVGMMDIVKPPEKRHPMIGPMPPPVGVVHEQKRGGNRYWLWLLQPVHQSHTSMLRPNCQSERDRQHCESDNYKTWNRDDVVTNQSTQHAKMLASQRKTPLKKKQGQNQNSEERVANEIEQRRQLHSSSPIVSARRNFARIK